MNGDYSVKGLELSRLFHEKTVRPILQQRFPHLLYSTGLLGEGSEVLGFDTPQSMDHDWGPRLLLFLSDKDFAASRNDVDLVLRRELPHEFCGYPTNFSTSRKGVDTTPAEESSSDHSVVIFTIGGFVHSVLGFDVRGVMSATDWVRVPSQLLLSLTAGDVFHDGLGQLEAVREGLRYYPRPVWLYLLAAQWRRIGQEEAFMGRCGQVGDDLGSALIAARLIRDLMRLCFLMERRYAPYNKWLGTAFTRLGCADHLCPLFARVFQARSWQEREAGLTPAYEFVARMHNDLAITDPIHAVVSPYYERPFLVIHADRFVNAIRARIDDEDVLALPAHLGSVDQFVDSTDALNCFDHMRCLYEY